MKDENIEMKKYLVALVKIFKEEKYRDDFIKGNIYANSCDFLRFVSNDINEVVFDPYRKLSLYSAQDGCTPITCFYAVISNEAEIKDNKFNIVFSKKQIGKLSKEFGDYVLVIINVPMFLNRILTKNNNVDFGLVKYLKENEKRSENVIFEKMFDFSEENEFRIIDKKKLFCLEKNKLIQMSELQWKHGKYFNYKLPNGKNFVVTENNQFATLYDIDNSQDRMIMISDIDVDLYKNDFSCYTEETLKSQHYLVEGANISELCVKYNLQDLRKGVVLPFVGDRETCNIDNFKK